MFAAARFEKAKPYSRVREIKSRPSLCKSEEICGVDTQQRKKNLPKPNELLKYHEASASLPPTGAAAMDRNSLPDSIGMSGRNQRNRHMADAGSNNRFPYGRFKGNRNLWMEKAIAGEI